MVTNKGDRSRNLLEIYHLSNYNKFMILTTRAGIGYYGARPTKHISIEFEIRWKFRML